MGTFTLTAASGIQRSADVYTSKEGPDVGSTYFRFSCVFCQHMLGVYYLTTSKDLDDLREKFTFIASSVNCYEMGSSQHGMIEPLIVDAYNSSTSGAPSSSSSSGSSDVELSGVKDDVMQVTGIPTAFKKVTVTFFPMFLLCHYLIFYSITIMADSTRDSRSDITARPAGTSIG